MIVVLLFLFVVFAFVSIMMFKNKLARIVGTIVGIGGVVLSVGLITANMSQHFGMKTEVKTTKTQIYSASNTKGYGVLLYQAVGTNGKENVYIFRHALDAKQPTVVKPDLKTSTERTTISGDKAYQVTKDTRYVYKNDFWKFMFNIADNDGELKQRSVSYQLPDNWLAMTTQQAKELQAKLTPKTDEEKAAFAQKQKAIAEMTQNDPQAAAKLQIQQIKSVLGI